MTYNLEDLPALDEGFEDVEIQWGWICHSCKTITLVNDWSLLWNDNNIESQTCSNQACKHVRCESCQSTSSLGLPFQQEYSFATEGVLDNSNFMNQPEDLESFETAWKLYDSQLLPTESQAPTAEQLLGSSKSLEVPPSTGDAALDEIMRDILSPKPSEAIMAAILKDILGIQDDPEGPKIPEDATINPIFETHTSPAAPEPSPADIHPTRPPPPPPPPSPSLPPPSPRPMIPCPHQHTHSCTRTFHLAHHATRHAQIHTHPFACPAARCASRFTTACSLRAHTTRIHSLLQDIADLDERYKGPLAADAGPDGKSAVAYPCRFRDVLGCGRRFGQNGHANRHALGHCRRAWRCGVGACRARFVVRGNWEGHRWGVHGLTPWD